jgi:aquaporin Z
MPDSSSAAVPIPNLTRRAVAEAVGTFVLVFFGVGSAVFGKDTIGVVGIALAFGFVLLALAYAIGPVCGCHVNPAVTLGLLLRKGITRTEAVYYWGAQLVGAIVAAALLKLMVSGFGGATDKTGALGTNNWGTDITAGGTFVLEVVLTFLLVLVILLVTNRAAAPGFAGLAIGLVLTVIHLVGIPLDGTSVNPARSIGPALLNGGEPVAHVWMFIVAPLVGGAVAALAAPYFETAVSKTDFDPTGADVPE